MNFPGLITELDPMEMLPYVLAARAAADEYFCDIPVVVADEGNVAETIKQLEAVITSKKMKRGVAVVFLQIDADDEYQELALGPLLLRASAHIVELREINRDPKRGTGKTWRKVARQLRNVIKTFSMPGFVSDMMMDTPGIQPMKFEAVQGQNVIGGQINFKTYEDNADRMPTQCERPILALAGSILTCTCETPQATIYYTTDGSYPWSGNDQALPFVDPINIPQAGFYISACAYAPGMIASRIVRAAVTPD